MSLSYNTYYAIPYLKDYAAAAAREAAVKPIRGDDEGRKPLGRRDQKYRRIMRDTDGSTIIFEDWSDRGWYIRFTPDNELHLYDTAWAYKATHNEVMERVTGLTFFTEADRMWVRYDGGTAPVPSRAGRHWDRAKNEWTKVGEDPEPMVLTKNERGNWVPKNVVGLVTHHVNRKGAKAVRERYAAGLAYVEALVSLRRDNWPDLAETVKAFRDTVLKDCPEDSLTSYWRVNNFFDPNHERAAQLVTLLGSDDPGDQYKAFLWLARRHSTLEPVLKMANRVLAMHHRDEWFKRIEHEPGVKAVDKYRWAFPA